MQIGETALSYKSTKKEGAPRRRGPAKILDIDETGATAKFQSQTFKVARYFARTKVGERDVEDADRDPSHARMRAAAAVPRGQSTQRDMGDVTDADEEKGNLTSSTDT